MDSPQKQQQHNFISGGLLISAGPQHNFNRGRFFNHTSTLLALAQHVFLCALCMHIWLWHASFKLHFVCVLNACCETGARHAWYIHHTKGTQHAFVVRFALLLAFPCYLLSLATCFPLLFLAFPCFALPCCPLLFLAFPCFALLSLAFPCVPLFSLRSVVLPRFALLSPNFRCSPSIFPCFPSVSLASPCCPFAPMPQIRAAAFRSLLSVGA